MKQRLPFLIYLLGMLPLGYWQGEIRNALGDWLAFAAMIAYLLLLRLVGHLAVRYIDWRRQQAIIAHNHQITQRKSVRK